MRHARDPRRRNRKLGTPDFAWRDRGSWAPRYDMPWPRWEGRAPGARWSPRSIEKRTVHGRPLRIVVERPLRGWWHACTPDDVVEVLSRLPSDDVEGLGLVVLLQPSRREDAFEPVWGRMHGAVEFRGYVGPVVTLAAIDAGLHVVRWGRSLQPYERDRLERLRATGFKIERGRRGCTIRLDPVTVRRWQREWTLPHEVGHWVDFRARVLDPTGHRKLADARNHPDYESLLRRWDRRPYREVERSADAYVDAHRTGAVPRP